MTGRRHDATGRSTSKLRNRRQETRTGPPTGEPWAFMSLALMESEAVRSLSVNARRVLDRLIIEHFRHNRLENGNLRVSARQFHEWRVTKDCLTPAIRELEAKGLLDVEFGRPKGVLMPPMIFRLTFYATGAGEEPASNEWKAWTPDATPKHSIIDVPRSRDGENVKIGPKKGQKRPVCPVN